MEVNNEPVERQETFICVCGQGFTSSQFSIQCDHCKKWFHGFCVQLQEFEAEEVDKFYCNNCQNNNPGLKTVPKPVTNNWRHNRTEANPEAKPIQAGTSFFIDKLKNRTFKDAKSDETVVKRMRGQQLTLKELLLNGFNVPILVESKDGLELTVPSNGFTAKSLLDYYSADHVLDVIDVRRQLNIKMRVQDFVDKLSVPPDRRPSIYNCISLEVSNNALSSSVRPPNIVNKLSWVDNYWPPAESKPSVSKYCLISMKDSYTDFHIDFGGTSVWYHVLSGEKVFFIIKPTKENLDHYENWMSSDQTSDQFLAEKVGLEQCYRLNLFAGQTLFIPTGWIHAVLTPQDSLVFGGNFLHSLSIELQLKVRQMEQRMKTPFKFQFPFFEMTHWYAAPNVLKLLEDSLKQKPPKHLVDGVLALVPQLKTWLKKSKDFQNQNEFQISSLAPKGFNCIKLIKDLNSSVKKAIRKLEGQPINKKRGKPYKEFDFKDKEESIGLLKMIDSLPESQTSPKATDTNVGTSMAVEDKPMTDRTLVIDDSSKVPKIRSLSTDSESKGSLKLKLSISGAKEILGSSCEDNQNISDLKDLSLESQFLSPRFENDSNSSSPKRQKKRKRDSREEPIDDEIASMVKGLPEDDNYIYFDLETPADEEASSRGKAASKDEPWAPKAKVTIKATPKAPRQPRDDAKRVVVETTIANAAAIIESLPTPKRQYVKKKEKPKCSISSISKESSLESDSKESSIVTPNVTANTSATGPSNPQSGANRTPTKAKKGLKTPKQRLHKIICQKKRSHF